MEQGLKISSWKERSRPVIVACIPAFNEEKSIGGVVLRTSEYVDKVIVCDDGSKDLTGDIAKRLGAIVVRHERNFGYGAALRSLFNEALSQCADIVVTLDGDGQHEPAEISRLVNALVSKELDIVIGSRFVSGGDSDAPTWRKKGIQLISKLTSNGKQEITDAQSGFRAYSNKAIKSLVLTEDGMGISTEILLKASENGYKIEEVPTTITYTADSSTHNPVIHGVSVLISTIKHMSIQKPLTFYGLPGILSLSISLAFWIWAISIFTQKGKLITNITLIAVGTTIVGLVLMVTAIMLWVLISVVRETAIIGARELGET